MYDYVVSLVDCKPDDSRRYVGFHVRAYFVSNLCHIKDSLLNTSWDSLSSLVGGCDFSLSTRLLFVIDSS